MDMTTGLAIKMEVPLIECTNLSKTYKTGAGEVHAVENVSFSIQAGEMVAVMGASGSGKSTFMNMIGALDVPTSGTLRVEGQDLGSMNSDALALYRNQRIGFVFQQFNLLARADAVENVMLPMLYARVPRAEARERALKSLARVGLGDRSDHFPNQLSGGQQQRVAIARALVNNPDILLADEPTGALDTVTSHDIMELFVDLSRQGITIILVTHEVDVADYATRQIVFQDGAVIDDHPNEKQIKAKGDSS